MLYRSDHAYALPENPLVQNRSKASRTEQYVARTMIVDGRQVGFDPYALEDYDALEAEYAEVEPVEYIPVDGLSSAPGMRMAAADDIASRARQVAARAEMAAADRTDGHQVTVMRGTDRSLTTVEPAAARPRRSSPAIEAQPQVQSTGGTTTAAAMQSAVIVTDG